MARKPSSSIQRLLSRPTRMRRRCLKLMFPFTQPQHLRANPQGPVTRPGFFLGPFRQRQQRVFLPTSPLLHRPDVLTFQSGVGEEGDSS